MKLRESKHRGKTVEKKNETENENGTDCFWPIWTLIDLCHFGMRSKFSIIWRSEKRMSHAIVMYSYSVCNI